MSRRRIVLVGRRSAAQRAASGLGVEILRIDAAAPRAARRDGVVAHLPWPADPARHEAWQALAKALPEPGRIGAVVPLTEAAVLPAARLRGELGLDGMDVATALRCTDKLAMKTAIRASGIACADFLACEAHTPARALLDALGLPLVLKPRTGSGGRGQRLIRDARELVEPLPAGYLAERFVEGVELSSEALFDRGEMLFRNATEYLRVREANVVPAPLSVETAQAVDALQRQALRALGVERGIAHTEIFLARAGLVFGEVAVRPPGGHIMRLIELAYGFDPWQAWLRLHLDETLELPSRARQAAGAWVLHEGEGRVRSISDLEAVRRLPGVETVHVRVSVGSRVTPRLGSGEEIGHLIVVGQDRDQVAERLRAAHAALRIEMEP